MTMFASIIKSERVTVTILVFNMIYVLALSILGFEIVSVEY